LQPSVTTRTNAVPGRRKKRPAIDAALPDLANIDDGDEIDHA